MIRPTFFVADFKKTHADSWVAHDPSGIWQPSGPGAWQGDSLEVASPERSSTLRIHLVGVFNGPKVTVQFLSSRAILSPTIFRRGTHYGAEECSPGDGAIGKVVGSSPFGQVVRLSVDLPHECILDSIRITGASTVFEVCFEISRSCPFSARGDGVSLAEAGVAVRVGDRVRITRALDQLYRSAAEQPLDEARGSVLLFLAVVAAAQLEAGTRKPLHRFQLEAARRIDQVATVEQVVEVARELAEQLLGDLLEEKAPTDQLINRALKLVERGYARPLCDEDVADQLSLSTSHFRHLFKQATGHPFHQYLIAMRLEKARAMLSEQGTPVSEAARLVGFQSPAHFSRAFQRRFGIAPNAIRHAVRTTG